MIKNNNKRVVSLLFSFLVPIFMSLLMTIYNITWRVGLHLPQVMHKAALAYLPTMVVCLLLSNTIIRGLLVITTELFPRTAIKEDVLRILLMCIFMSLYSCIRFGAIWQGKMIPFVPGYCFLLVRNLAVAPLLNKLVVVPGIIKIFL